MITSILSVGLTSSTGRSEYKEIVDPPKGMIGLTIETTFYQKIVSKGKMPEAVFNTWLEIWANKELDANRAYKADFTIHGKKYYDGDNAEVETYLSVK